MTELEELIETLRNQGATRTATARDGGYARERYTLGGLTLDVEFEYGRTRVNVKYGEHESVPASFWLAALRGWSSYPDPVVTESDIFDLRENLIPIIQNASRYVEVVDQMAVDYRRAVRDRLYKRT